MKLLVFADSHTDVETMRAAVLREKPDLLLHLGDHAADAQALAKTVDCPLHFVRGNTDFGHNAPEELLLPLANRRIYMTHGYLHGVKNGTTGLYAAAARQNADIALFGHTHQPYLSQFNGIWLINPGRIGRRSARKIHATYGVVLLEETGITCAIVEADGE